MHPVVARIPPLAVPRTRTDVVGNFIHLADRNELIGDQAAPFVFPELDDNFAFTSVIRFATIVINWRRVVRGGLRYRRPFTNRRKVSCSAATRATGPNI